MHHAVPDGVGDIHSDAFSHQGVATLAVNHGTLFVHHIIIFQQTLTDTEVVFLHLLLRTLDVFGDDGAFDTFTLLETKTVHHPGYALAGKQTHQFVFKTHIEHRTTRVALTTGTTTQLPVHTAALMTLSTDDGQTACCLHFGRQLDVGTTTRHVGGDGHRTQQPLLLADGNGGGILFLLAPGIFLVDDFLVFHGRSLVAEGPSVACRPHPAHGALAGFCHDVGLLLVQLGVEHIMRNAAQVEHTAEQF